MSSPRQLVFLVASLVVGGVLGFIVGQSFLVPGPFQSPPPSPTPPEVVIETEALPIPPELLAHPVLTDIIIVNVSGEIVGKTENSLTIEKEGQQLILSVDAGTEITEASLTAQSLSLEEIPIGSTLLPSGATISSREEQALLGSYLFVIKLP